MSVSLVWSSTNGGTSLSSPVSHGNIATGDNTTAQTIYVRHNGSNPITAVSIYLSPVDESTYGGDFTGLTDKNELISWGDASTSPTFGGVQLNQNATGSFPAISWPTFANKTTADGYGFNVRTAVGDSTTNPITVLAVTGATANGTIQAGSAPNVRFQMRILAPDTATSLGTRQFNTRLKYVSTT